MAARRLARLPHRGRRPASTSGSTCSTTCRRIRCSTSPSICGSLGSRITATAGAVGALFGTVAGASLPPVRRLHRRRRDLLSSTGDGAGAGRLRRSLVAGRLDRCSAPRPAAARRPMPSRARRSAGELVDSVANVWTVKAFSAREREYRRACSRRSAPRRRPSAASWLHTEKARVLHDVCLWRDGGPHAGLGGLRVAGDGSDHARATSCIVERADLPHPARLARPRAGAGRRDAAVRRHRARCCGVVAQPHRVRDAPDAPAVRPRGGSISFARRAASRYMRARRRCSATSTCTIPAGQRVGIVGPVRRRQVDAGRR